MRASVDFTDARQRNTPICNEVSERRAQASLQLPAEVRHLVHLRWNRFDRPLRHQIDDESDFGRGGLPVANVLHTLAENRRSETSRPLETR